MLSALRLASRQASQRSTIAAVAAGRAAVSTWSNVPEGPPAILGITEAFNADTNPNKINLGVGAYRNKNGKPFVLLAARQADKLIVERAHNKEYLPITGFQKLLPLVAKFAYGRDFTEFDRLAITQSLSGTGALRIAAAFLARFYSGEKTVYLPNPSWSNHKPIFTDSGLNVKQYRYYNKDTIGLDFDGMVEDLKAAPKGSIVLLHACAHNPTGIDPTPKQWEKICEVTKEQGHFVLFDMAYQGFASGDINKDAFAVRHFVAQGHNIGLCQSFAKNLGLYGERLGYFSMFCADAAEKSRVESQLKIIIRPLYSSPPLHGALVAHYVFAKPTLYQQWLLQLKNMSKRIIDMRTRLRKHLEECGSKHDWSHLTSQIGMFAYTGLSADEVADLAKHYSVYATKDGRISVAGITGQNVEYLAKAIYGVKG